MHVKLGYKPFEYICDLQRIFARERTWAAEKALLDAQGPHWPWCLTEEQGADWNALCRRLDPDDPAAGLAPLPTISP